MGCRVLFFIVLCNFTMNLAEAQSGNSAAKEWAPIGAKWWYTFSGAGLDQNYLTLESVKDTMVLGKHCRKLEIKEYLAEGLIHPENNRSYYFENIGLRPRMIILHQQGDSIFYLRKNQFELLYDFSMEPGDTIAVTVPQQSFRYHPQDTQIFVRVEGYTTKIIDGQELKVQQRQIAWESGNGFLVGDTVVEKMGDLTFFLPWKSIEYDAILPYGLRCYQDSTIFYKAVDIPCDSITPLMSGTLPLVQSNDVVLYPNPVPPGTRQIKVEGVQVKNWDLYDVQGRLISKEEREFGEPSIDIPWNLQAGFYFLELRSDQARYTKPLVVQ